MTLTHWECSTYDLLIICVLYVLVNVFYGETKIYSCVMYAFIVLLNAQGKLPLIGIAIIRSNLLK